MDISQRIKEAREKAGLSMNALAKRSGAAQSAISQIEGGQRQPTFEVLEKIVTGLGLTLSEFFSDAQEQEPLPPEVRQICEKVKRLPPDKLKILNAVLDTWKED